MWSNMLKGIIFSIFNKIITSSLLNLCYLVRIVENSGGAKHDPRAIRGERGHKSPRTVDRTHGGNVVASWDSAPPGGVDQEAPRDSGAVGDYGPCGSGVVCAPDFHYECSRKGGCGGRTDNGVPCTVGSCDGFGHLDLPIPFLMSASVVAWGMTSTCTFMHDLCTYNTRA